MNVQIFSPAMVALVGNILLKANDFVVRANFLRFVGFLGLLAVVSTTPTQAQPVATPQDYTRMSQFVYYGVADGAKAGLLKLERVEPGNASQCVETEHSYDAYGNKVGATTRNCAGASGLAVFPTRSTSSSYAGYSITVNGVAISVPAGTFVSSATNAVSHSETRSIDPRFGALVSLTGPNTLTTSYTLDDWGRVERETRADGTSTRSLHCLTSGRVTDINSNTSGCRLIPALIAPAVGRSE